MTQKQVPNAAQYENKIRRIKAQYETQLRRAHRLNQAELNALKKEYEREIYKVSEAIEQRVQELQDKLEYHQEMNNAQRVMLEDAISYCKQLEQKLENIVAE
jgi:adenylosuccinate synthase